MTLYDISLPLRSSLAAWPGDTPYGYTLLWDLEQGHSVNVGSITMSAHSGTHIDAPYHFRPGGATVDRLDLTPFLGPARVVDVHGRDPICIADLPTDLAATPRLLLKTGAWDDPAQFPTGIPLIESDVPEYLHAQGVLLIGVDLPSLDAIDSEDLPNHHALAARNIQIMESLSLFHVPPGDYELIALPLALVGGDAAPVRAVLRAL